MFEQAQLILYGQVNERRLWGLALLVLSLAVAVPAAWRVSQMWIGYQAYIAGAGAFVVALLFSAQAFGPLLSRVRKRWFA